MCQIADSLQTGAGGSNGEISPDGSWSITTLGGDVIDSRDLPEGTTVISFWAENCGFCNIQQQELAKLASRQGEQAVTFVWANTDGLTGANLRRAATAKGNSDAIEVASANRALVQAVGGIRGTPVTVLLTRSGRVEQRFEGIVTAEVLDLYLRRELDQTPVQL